MDSAEHWSCRQTSSTSFFQPGSVIEKETRKASSNPTWYKDVINSQNIAVLPRTLIFLILLLTSKYYRQRRNGRNHGGFSVWATLCWLQLWPQLGPRRLPDVFSVSKAGRWPRPKADMLLGLGWFPEVVADVFSAFASSNLSFVFGGSAPAVRGAHRSLQPAQRSWCLGESTGPSEGGEDKCSWETSCQKNGNTTMA